MSIKEYLRRKDAIHNTTFIINKHGGFYAVDGVLIPMKQFERLNETPLSLITARRSNPVENKGEQLDGRNAWLNIH